MIRLLAVLAVIVASASPGWAATYYVKKTGNNANSCATATNSSTPKLTINSALACLTAPGDILRIGQGTYVESIIYTALPVSGTSANHITITKIVGENRPLIQPNTGCYGLLMDAARNYIDYIDLDFSGINMNDCGLASAGSLVSAGSSDGPTGTVIRDMDIADSPGSNLFNGSGLLIENVTLHGTGWRAQAIGYPAGSNGFYGAKLRNSVVRRLRTYDNQCFGFRVFNSGAGGVKASNNIIEYTYSYQNGQGKGLNGTSTCTGGAFVIGDDNNTVRYSVGDNGGLRCLWVLRSANGTNGTKLYNNTCTRHTYGMVFEQAAVTNTTVSNNIFLDNTTYNIGGTATGTILQTNITTGTLSTYTPGNGVFSLKAGSAAIDAGTNVGLPYNGSAPDIGAFETFTFASCEVPNSAADTIQITFTSNVHLLGSTLTTFTARRNGGANALTGAATKIGDTIVSLPLTDTYVGGDTVDWSWASGGLTDNARIGGTLNQPFLPVTNQSCTNNAGGAPTYVLSQVRYQFRGLYGPETTTDIRGTDNIASYEIQQGGAGRVRIVVTDATSNAPNTAFILRYSRNGGGYTIVPDTYGADGIAFCGAYYTNLGVTNGQFTTAQISAVAGTHVPNSVILNSNAIPTINGLQVGYKTEGEYCVSFDITASGTFTLQLWEQSGLAFTGTYLEPTITVVNPSSSAGLN